MTRMYISPFLDSQARVLKTVAMSVPFSAAKSVAETNSWSNS